MKYHRLNPDIFTTNRDRFTATMEPNSLAFFNASDIYPTSADGNVPFIQATDLFWLSGVDQEAAILLLFPDAKKPEHREMLFLTETNEHIAVWEGAKLDKQSATEVSQVKSVHWLEDFDKVLKEVMAQVDHVYLLTHEHIRRSSEGETREERFG